MLLNMFLLLFSLLGDLFKKVQGLVVSKWIGMKSGGNVRHINTHELTESDFFICCHNFKMVAMTSYHSEKCRHLVTKHEVSVRVRVYIQHSSVHQVLICISLYSCLFILLCSYVYEMEINSTA